MAENVTKTWKTSGVGVTTEGKRRHFLRAPRGAPASSQGWIFETVS